MWLFIIGFMKKKMCEFFGLFFDSGVMVFVDIWLWNCL